MKGVSEKEGRTVLFVSHNMQAIRQMCERVIFLKHGQLTFDGDPHTAISAYLGQGTDAASHASVDLADFPRPHASEGAKLLRVRFLDGQGQPAQQVRMNDLLGVEVDFAVSKPLRNGDLAMAVIHAEGLRIFSETYSDQDVMPDLAPGEYTFRFHVPMRFFKLESYFLTLAISENGKSCDSIDGLLMPEIVDENPNLHKETNRWGVLRVPVTWDVIQPVAMRR